jgi:Flp pilus assembly protein TadG
MREYDMTTQIGGRGRAVSNSESPATRPNILRRAARHLAHLAGAERGNAAIEFALATPILIGLLVPVADLGIAFSQQLQVQQAAQAGAQYALLHGYNSTAISNAVTAASTLSGVSAYPAPTQGCGCPTGTAITAAACSSVCSNGETAGTYVYVNARYTYTTVLPYSVLGSGMDLTAQSTVRIQ